MAKRNHRRPGPPADLDPYLGCRADVEIGAEPLAVGWLRRNQSFPTGMGPDGFFPRLLDFCREAYTVCTRPVIERCPLCGVHVPPIIMPDDQTVVIGAAEIRVIGETEIYAAPTMIIHHVVEHHYLPPKEFVVAVLTGPPAGSPEHRALVRAMRTMLGQG